MHGAPDNTCECMHTLRKNAYGLVHVRLCNCAEASLPWKLVRTDLESCASIVQTVVCRPLLQPLLLSRPNPSSDAVRSRFPSKSTLAQDAVTAQCCTRIIRSSAMVQASSSLSMGRTRTWTRGSHHQEFYFGHFFARVFWFLLCINRKALCYKVPRFVVS